MIYRDELGFPVDQTGDGGDSAMRHGLLCVFEKITQHPYTMLAYEAFGMSQPGSGIGLLRRHPSQEPWNNPWNFSRDQLIPAITGAYAMGEIKLCRRVFYAHFKRLFFCQNFERDKLGSTKYPWPHTFIDDHGNKQTKLFDFADPLMPDHVWHFIRCGRLWPLYWFAIIGIPWFCFSLLIHSRSSHKEHNQIICQCKVQGKWAMRLFKSLIPNWRSEIWEYWYTRSEPEYAKLIIDDLDDL